MDCFQVKSLGIGKFPVDNDGQQLRYNPSSQFNIKLPDSPPIDDLASVEDWDKLNVQLSLICSNIKIQEDKLKKNKSDDEEGIEL